MAFNYVIKLLSEAKISTRLGARCNFLLPLGIVFSQLKYIARLAENILNRSKMCC